jgi:hypothetical protein
VQFGETRSDRQTDRRLAMITSCLVSGYVTHCNFILNSIVKSENTEERKIALIQKMRTDMGKEGNIIHKQETLGRINRLLHFDTSRSAQ